RVRLPARGRGRAPMGRRRQKEAGAVRPPGAVKRGGVAMLKSKAGPVVGGIVGLLALVGLAVKLVSPGAGGNALEKRVDEYAARERDETPEARHRDVPKRLDELQALQK